MSYTELELLRDDLVVRVITIEEAEVTLGRDLANRVVLVDDNVSGHHAVVQRGASGVTVRDLGSTNGTFVNGERVNGRADLADGDELRLGPEVRFRVRQVAPFPSGILVLRDLSAGIVHALDRDRLLIGTAPSSDVRLPDGPARAATLVVHADGETWLGSEQGDTMLAIDEAFEVGGSRFRLELVAEPGSSGVTARPTQAAVYPYRLMVTLDAAAGALAELTDLTNGNACHFRSDQRVSLLYLLARQLQTDRENRVVPVLAGWCHDEDIMVGVWGRGGLTGASSKYSVLLHRVRRTLEEGALDPYCIEKRRGGIRLIVQELHFG